MFIVTKAGTAFQIYWVLARQSQAHHWHLTVRSLVFIRFRAKLHVSLCMILTDKSNSGSRPKIPILAEKNEPAEDCVMQENFLKLFPVTDFICLKWSTKMVYKHDSINSGKDNRHTMGGIRMTQEGSRLEAFEYLLRSKFHCV